MALLNQAIGRSAGAQLGVPEATGLLLYGHRYKPRKRRAEGLSRITSSVARAFREFF